MGGKLFKGGKPFKGGNYSKEETIVLSQFSMPQAISINVFITQNF